jgi:hypothetical protein
MSYSRHEATETTPLIPQSTVPASPLNDLPLELKEMIVYQLPVQDLAQLSQASRDWHEVCQNILIIPADTCLIAENGTFKFNTKMRFAELNTCLASDKFAKYNQYYQTKDLVDEKLSHYSPSAKFVVGASGTCLFTSAASLVTAAIKFSALKTAAIVGGSCVLGPLASIGAGFIYYAGKHTTFFCTPKPSIPANDSRYQQTAVVRTYLKNKQMADETAPEAVPLMGLNRS